ncbi:MAG: DUF6285 domain-containing protein [Pseudomonadota bacterium]
MHNQPSPTELLSAVKSFIDDTAKPELTGHAAFHARVASNALAIVIRDLDSRAASEVAETARLQAILERSDEMNLDVLNKYLCDRIRAGELTINTPGLLSHLKATAIAQVEVDQPRYSGLKSAVNPQ